MERLKYEIDEFFLHHSAWIIDVHRNFEQLGTVLRSKRNIIRLVNGPDGNAYVIKRYKEPNLIQKIGYSFFRKSKAERAFAFARYLKSNDIKTPFPVAYVEVYKGCFLKTCYFISTYLQGESCWSMNDDAVPNAQLSRSLALFLVRMHEVGFMHGDTNLSNFAYTETETGYEISTCDINRSQIKECSSQQDCLKNLMRLSHEVPTVTRIVTDYANLRSWDPAYCLDYVLLQIKQLERWEDFRGLITFKKPEYRHRKKRD